MTGHPIILTEQQEQEIIAYYLADHSIKETTLFFNFSNKRVVNRVLDKYNIQKHSAKHTQELKVQKCKATCTERYGVSNISQLDSIKDKKKRSSIEKYGTEYVFQAEEIKDKSKLTCLSKYDVEYYTQTAEYKEKAKLTNLEKYGAEHPAQSTQIKSKIQATCQQIYGVSCVLKSELIKTKVKQTNLERYGVEYPTQSELVRQKVKLTLKEHYGVENFSQTSLAAQYRKSAYTYQGLLFDSLPELAVYLYAIEHSQTIIREPLALYFEFNAKIHACFPDFEINGELVEIKGDQFFDGNKMICPFDRNLDDLYEAKHQCYLANNVKILTSDLYKDYLDWFYGHGYKKEDFYKKL